MNISDCIENYMRIKKVKNISKNTTKAYLLYLNKFKDFVSNKNIEDVALNDVLNFVESGNSVLTKKFVITVLKSFFRHFGLIDLVNKIPYPKGTGKEIRPLDKEDVVELLRKCNTKSDRAMILLMISSGLRISEVINLKIKDINFIDKEGKVWSKGKKKYETPDQFVFNEEAKKAIVEYLNNRINNVEEYLFTRNNKTFEAYYYYLWTYFKRKFGIRPHQLRHTFCYLYAKKLLPTEVQMLARHKSFESTRRYINPEMKKVIREYRKTENIFT